MLSTLGAEKMKRDASFGEETKEQKVSAGIVPVSNLDQLACDLAQGLSEAAEGCAFHESGQSARERDRP